MSDQIIIGTAPCIFFFKQKKSVLRQNPDAPIYLVMNLWEI